MLKSVSLHKNTSLQILEMVPSVCGPRRAYFVVIRIQHTKNCRYYLPKGNIVTYAEV